MSTSNWFFPVIFNASVQFKRNYGAWDLKFNYYKGFFGHYNLIVVFFQCVHVVYAHVVLYIYVHGGMCKNAEPRGVCWHLS